MVGHRVKLAGQVSDPVGPASARVDRRFAYLARDLYGPCARLVCGSLSADANTGARRLRGGSRAADKAAWVDNEDVADADVLSKILTANGLDAPKVLADAESAAVKVGTVTWLRGVRIWRG